MFCFQKRVLDQLTSKPINCHRENRPGYGALLQSTTKAESKRRIGNDRQDEERDGKEEEKEAEKETTCEDWRAVLKRLNDQVKQVVKLPDVVEKVESAPITKDYVDIKIQYRRIKIK